MPPSVEQHTCTKSRYFLSQLLTNCSPLSFWKRQCANCFTQEYYIWIHFNTQKHTVWGRDFYTSKKERGRVWLTAIVKKKRSTRMIGNQTRWKVFTSCLWWTDKWSSYTSHRCKHTQQLSLYTIHNQCWRLTTNEKILEINTLGSN